VIADPAQDLLQHEPVHPGIDFSRLPGQYELILFSRHHDAEGAEVPVLSELARETGEILTDVFGQIAGKFHRRGTKTWASHIHLALALADDLVPAAPEEPDILKALNS
jgi:hypothetical protein